MVSVFFSVEVGGSMEVSEGVSEGASVDTSEEYSDDAGSVGWSANAGVLNDRAAVAIKIANNDYFMIDSILSLCLFV